MIVEVDATPTQLPDSTLRFQVQGSAPVFHHVGTAAPVPGEGHFKADQREIVETGVLGGTVHCWVWASTPTMVVTR